MPSGSSIRRLAKYSHDTADGDDEAMIAPPTTSNCGPELAIMPGVAVPRKPRISASNAMRSGVATLLPRRKTRTDSCSSPAMPTVAATISAASWASCRQPSSAIITPINAMLNRSGEKAVSAKRACAFNNAIMTVTGPAKAR